MKSSVLVFALGFAFALPATAQQVTLRGEVEDVPRSPGQFVLNFTEVKLIGAGASLGALAEQKVVLTGEWDGNAATPTVVVTSASPSTETFEIDGALKVGGACSIALIGTPGTPAFGYLSTSLDFVPLPNGEVALIDFTRIVFSVATTIPGSGEREVPFSIPNNPALAGLQIFGQGAFLSGGFIEVSNPYSATIVN